ncbi:unnamed protein product [Discosporangium mesarthrocarpum]
MLRQQVAVHQAEFVSMEASTSRELGELQLLLSAERTKVRAFEELELELDTAVVRAGESMLQPSLLDSRDQGDNVTAGPGLGPGLGEGQEQKEEQETGQGEGKVLGKGKELELVLGVLPTAPQRRMRQAVTLAHKLLKKEGELEAARKGLREAEERADSMEKRAERAEGILHNVEQPTKYMVDTIRGKENEVEVLKADLRRLRGKTQELEQSWRSALMEKSATESKLEAFLREREDVEALRVKVHCQGCGGRGERGKGSEARLPPTSPEGQAPLHSVTRNGEDSVPHPCLSEQLTSHHGGGRSVEGSRPRWYRHSKLVKVPA